MSIIASDLFTDTNGTALPSHTSTSGHSWVKTSEADSGAPGDFVINSNRAGVLSPVVSKGARAVLVVNPGNANYSLTGVCFEDDNANSSLSLWVRSESSAFTGYQCYRDAGSWDWNIRRTVAGVETHLVATSGVASVSVGSSITVVFTVADGAAGSADLTVSVDTGGGPITATVNDATPITAIGNPGIAIIESGSTHPSISWDSVSVDGTAGGGTSQPTQFHRFQTYSRRRR